MMKTAIMQPYFLPYIGYFQLIAAVDTFVVYDKIKYTKKGWINRNRMLLDGRDVMFSLPLKKGSDYLDVVEREIADDFSPAKFLAQFSAAYRRAPNFDPTFELLRSVLEYDDRNLFGFIHHSLQRLCTHMAIKTKIQVSSSVLIDNDLKGQDKVLAMCTAVGTSTYLNPIGGKELYSHDAFASRGMELRFLRSRLTEYPQFGAAFVPWLSIIDVLMFNSPTSVQAMIAGQFDFE